MKFNVRFIPVIVTNALAVTIIITTTLAYYLGHITHVVPYISDTGTTAPESMIFGQAMNIIWVLMSFAIYCKFRQVKDILLKHNMTHKNTMNKYALIIGLMAAFGVSLVGNFPETLCFPVHFTGAALAFGGGSVYVCLQTSLYLTIAPVIGQILLTKVRVVIAIVTMNTFVIYTATTFISFSQFNGENKLQWKSEDGGFIWHNVSTVTEWICALSIATFIMFMGEEFKCYKMYEPEIEIGLQRITNT